MHLFEVVESKASRSVMYGNDGKNRTGPDTPKQCCDNVSKELLILVTVDDVTT